MTNNSAEAVFIVAPKPPTLELSLEEKELGAEVSETMHGEVHFNGTVRLAGNDAFQLAVELEPSLDTGWFCSCSPRIIVTSDDDTHWFEVVVVVPEETPAEPSGVLTVNAQALGGGFQLNASARALVDVMPYYRVMIESDVPYKEITPGSLVSFSIKVWNYGNAVDTLELDIVNLRDLVNDHWTITLSTIQLAKIPVEEYRVVNVTAQSPREETFWKERPSLITIRIISVRAREDQGLTVTWSYSLVAYERGSYPPNYNCGTVGLTVAILAALVIAVAWRWRSRRKKRPAAAAQPGNRGSKP
jgi:hypothetical protein